MKRIMALIFAVIVIIVMTTTAFATPVDLAETGKTVLTIGDWVYEKIENDTYYEIDEYVGEDEEVYVPRFVGNTLVIKLGDHCFMNNTTITDVITSAPLWIIGEYAFIDCTALESIELNGAMHTIETGAFSGTSSLKNINLQDSVVTEIMPFTFLNSGIELISLPDTCVKIGSYAFGQCTSLFKITIPESVTEIHENAFKGSDNVVIYCYTDSYAHQYAEEMNIPYVLLDSPVSKTFLLGDTDGSDYVDVVDATWIQRYAAQMDVTPIADTLMNGDVDDDGDPSVIDATMIMRYSVDIQTPYAIGEMVTRA